MKRLLAFVLLSLMIGSASAFTVSGPSYNGLTLRQELPTSEHMRNVGGSDGAGLCVFTSMELSGKYQNEPGLIGLQAYMRQRPGGGHPDKVDTVMRSFAPGVRYVQHTGGDVAFLELALRTGRYPSVTYSGNDGVYYRSRVAHMVNLVYLDDDVAAIQDNNYPGQWLWMSRQQFIERWKGGSNGGWAVVALSPGAPPKPVASRALPVQCPGGVCPAPGRTLPATPKPSNKLEWFSRDIPGVYLYEGETIIGQIDETTGVYTDATGAVAVPPVGTMNGRVINYGVDQSKIPQGDRYTQNGVPVSKEQAFEAFGDGLIDDSHHKYLTFVGTSADRTAFLKDVKDPEIAKLLATVKVQAYQNDHWIVNSRGFKQGLTLQEGDGKLIRTSEYTERDPGKLLDFIMGRQPLLPSLPFLPSLPNIGGSPMIGFGLMLILLLFRDSITGWIKRRFEPAPPDANAVALAALLAELKKQNEGKNDS